MPSGSFHIWDSLASPQEKIFSGDMVFLVRKGNTHMKGTDNNRCLTEKKLVVAERGLSRMKSKLALENIRLQRDIDLKMLKGEDDEWKI